MPGTQNGEETNSFPAAQNTAEASGDDSHEANCKS